MQGFLVCFDFFFFFYQIWEVLSHCNSQYFLCFFPLFSPWYSHYICYHTHFLPDLGGFKSYNSIFSAAFLFSHPGILITHTLLHSALSHIRCSGLCLFFFILFSLFFKLHDPLQYSCLKNPRDRGAWWAAVHRVTWAGVRHDSATDRGEPSLPVYLQVH